VVFSSNAPGNYEIMSIRADGSDPLRLTESRNVNLNVTAATDAPRIAFERITSDDNSDIVLTMDDGSNQIQISTSHATALFRFSERKPAFIPGSSQLLFVRRPPGRDGESLAIMDVEKRMAIRELVKPVKDHALVYAVSPDGSSIVFHQLAEWGRRNSSLSLIGIDGTPMKNISLGRDVQINDVSWGAHMRKAPEEP
jgi:Tol biopolymer transport system component